MVQRCLLRPGLADTINGRGLLSWVADAERLEAGDALTCSVGVEVAGLEPVASSARTLADLSV
jgi:hypothetical protein